MFSAGIQALGTRKASEKRRSQSLLRNEMAACEAQSLRSAGLSLSEIGLELDRMGFRESRWWPNSVRRLLAMPRDGVSEPARDFVQVFPVEQQKAGKIIGIERSQKAPWVVFVECASGVENHYGRSPASIISALKAAGWKLTGYPYLAELAKRTS